MTRLLLLILATLPAAAAPVLHSRPGSPHTLYLDFDGTPAELWGPFTPVPAIPAYAGTAADVRTAWGVVARLYAPFDVDVTTVDPGSYEDNVAVRVVVGGTNFLGTGATGVAWIGAFTDYQPNTGYAFAAMLNSDPTLTGQDAAHEAGHLFDLEHQSDWVNGVKVGEYRNGTIMGLPYTDPNATFGAGLDTNGIWQDDAAVLTGVLGPAPVGEPATALLACGAVVVGCQRRPRRRSSRHSGPRPASSGTAITRSTVNHRDPLRIAASASGALTCSSHANSFSPDQSIRRPINRNRMGSILHKCGGK